MASQVEIANAALQKLGSAAITSFDDVIKQARESSRCYDRLRLKLLRDHNWRFAIKRAQLPALSDEPLFGYSNQYQLPSDFVKLAPVDALSNRLTRDWQVEGRRILTNDDAPLNIRYIYDVQDPNEMDAIFRDLLAVDMAFEMCEPLTQSNQKKQALREDRKDLMNQAKRANAWETTPVGSPPGSWVTARYGTPRFRPGVIDELGV